MDEGKRLFKNTAIIALGNISTKVITFLMLPVYTTYLTTTEYGVYDYVHTMALFVLPLITLLLEESIFRFLVDAREDKERLSIIANAFVLVLYSILFFTGVYGLSKLFFDFQYYFAIYLYVLCLPFTTMINAIFRGMAEFKYYTLHNVVDSLLVTFFSVMTVFIGICNVESLLYSSAMGRFIGLVIIFVYTKLWRYFDFSLVNYKEMKELFCFSYPLISNRIAPMGLTVFDRSIILILLGAVTSGFYAVSSKIGLIIITIYSFFSISWQETASRIVKEDNASKFYSSVFEKMSKIMWAIIINMVAFTPVFFFFLINKKFDEAMYYVPLLLVGTYFNCIGVFLGGILIAYKDTKSMGITVIKYSLLQVIITLVTIKFFGIYSVILASVVANGLFIYLRIKAVDRHISIDLPSSKDIFVGLFAMLVTSCLFLKRNLFFDTINCFFAVIYGVYILNSTGASSQISGFIKRKFANRK